MSELTDGFYCKGERVADTKAPIDVPIARHWEERKFRGSLMNPTSRRRLRIIMVGIGLTGGAAAASLGEMGYHVDAFYYQGPTWRARSIVAQGGIDAAKNYCSDNDSTYRLFYDTVKGGGYRAREDNMYHLAEASAKIIRQCVAQEVPFAREYGGLLDSRLFGGVQIARTFYTRGQTGQQPLIGAYQAFSRQIRAGTVIPRSRCEMMDLIAKDGRAQDIVTRDTCTGKIKPWIADAVILAAGGYGNVFFLSANTTGCSGSTIWSAYEQGAYFGNPCYTQIHPTCIPQHGDFQSKLTLIFEPLRDGGRAWVPKRVEDCSENPHDVPEEGRDHYLEHIYPSFGNLMLHDIASRQAENVCDEGHGVGPRIGGVVREVCLDFSETINRMGRDKVSEKYGNLFDMYERITGDNPYEVPMCIYPVIHYTVGGLWVDYDLMSNIPGLYATGKANSPDREVNRLGASTLVQGLSGRYFVMPATLSDYLARGTIPKLKVDDPAVTETLGRVHHKINTLMGIQGTRSADSFHKELSRIMWEKRGMGYTDAGLRETIGQIRALHEEFQKDLRVPGRADELNQSLGKAYRLAGFMELGELMCIDAPHRRESCRGHFRVESQTEEDETKRDDEDFLHVTV